jgi:prepilin-type N-terminal cleavage/methylation domain-containing protein/prepilin-type processing-associated H-X9-DG protein
MRRNRSVRKGFTLLELLVVIAIVCMLAALLLPALSMAKAHAYSTTCKNHLRQMGAALQMYVHDHENKYPYNCNPGDPSLDDAIGPANTRYWWAKLLPYYPLKWTNAAYHCPGYRGVIAGEVGSHPPFGSYAYNAIGVSFPVGFSKGGIDVRPNPSFGLGPTYHKGSRWSVAVSETRIKVPSEMFALGESRFLNVKINGIPGGYDDMVCGWLKWDARGHYPYAFDPARHGKNYNQAFCDGHVSALSPWVLFNPTNTASMWNSDHQPHPELWIPE